MATGEGGVADGRDTAGDRDGGQPVAVVERGVADGGDGSGDGDGGQVGTSIERAVADGANRVTAQNVSDRQCAGIGCCETGDGGMPVSDGVGIVAFLISSGCEGDDGQRDAEE